MLELIREILTDPDLIKSLLTALLGLVVSLILVLRKLIEDWPRFNKARLERRQILQAKDRLILQGYVDYRARVRINENEIERLNFAIVNQRISFDELVAKIDLAIDEKEALKLKIAELEKTALVERERILAEKDAEIAKLKLNLEENKVIRVRQAETLNRVMEYLMRTGVSMEQIDAEYTNRERLLVSATGGDDTSGNGVLEQSPTPD